MMDHVTLNERPQLKRPVLIVAFSGWGDGGSSATIALEYLTNAWNASRIGEVQSELFYDFEHVRPWVRLNRDGERAITWPSLSIYAHHDARGDLDALLLVGPEPTLRWQTLTREIVELVRAFDVRLVVTLGAYLSNVSHRERVPLSGWAWPRELDEKLKSLDLEPVVYEGPTGMLSVLAVALADANVPVASLWAGVPGYLGASPNPKGALALVRCLDRALDLGLDLTSLEQRSREFEQQVDGLVARVKAFRGVVLQDIHKQRDEIGAEQQLPADAGTPGPVDLPTPDEAVTAVEEFLRRKDDLK